MGECHCSKIAIMQLFHELKQQFPALPDHVVSQCIAQNSHDRETCARSLRATQESRPPPGAFPPPPPPQSEPLPLLSPAMSSDDNQQQQQSQTSNSRQSMPTVAKHRAHRPLSLDIGSGTRRQSVQAGNQQTHEELMNQPSSAPADAHARRFFEELSTVQANSGFALNVNVACNPAAPTREYTAPITVQCEEAPILEAYQDLQQQSLPPALMLATCSEPTPRSFTSVSLTLRPPTSEPQPPIDISSQGTSLTYSSSSLDPRGFQSLLQISIGHGSSGGAASARIKPPPVPQRPNSLVILVHNPSGPNRPPGLPVGPPSQLPRPTTTMSAPTTPSCPVRNVALPPPTTSLPTTPVAIPSTSLGAIPRVPQISRDDTMADELTQEDLAILEQVDEEHKALVTEQLIRKHRLAKALETEEAKLEELRKEIEELSRPAATNISPKDIERQLRSEIYQLQLECDKLAEEVDKQSADLEIPLGETNEEFYQSIYTGQQLAPQATNVPPPLPSQPPAWEPVPNRIESQEEADGPSWVCTECTFNNHPLLNRCEQCNTPRLAQGAQGETQDIHIRVTHHHNFSPRRTVHNWVV